MRWTGQLGRSWGYRQAYYDYLEPDGNLVLPGTLTLNQPGQDQLPAFYQWDAGLAYSRAMGRVDVQARLNVINLSGRRNVMDWVLEPEDDSNYQRQARFGMPRFPSASLRIQF